MDRIEALTEAINSAPEIEIPAPVVEVPAAEPVITEQTAADKARDDKGRFAPKTEPASTAQAAPVATSPVAAAPAAVESAAAPRAAPSSWAKERHADFAALPATVQDYIAKRESDFANGVHAYKQEAESAREMKSAIEPFLPILQQAGIPAGRWIQDVGQTHRTLAMGDPQSKLATVNGLLQNYQVPARLVVQDAQGQWVFANHTQPSQPAVRTDDIKRMVREELIQDQTQATLTAFLADVPQKYPHYETVKSAMAGLLQTGQAQDLASAYEKAVRLDDGIWEQVQQARTQDAEKQRLAAEATRVAQARAKVTSTRSATPGSPLGGNGKLGRRETIAEAFDSAENRV